MQKHFLLPYAIFLILTFVVPMNRFHAQALKNSFGVNIGYGGGDGTEGDITYDFFYGRKFNDFIQLRVSYYVADNDRPFDDPYYYNIINRRESFLESQWVSANNTSKNPSIEITTFRMFSLACNIRMNQYRRSAIYLMPSINYYNNAKNYLSGSGPTLDDFSFSTYSYSGINGGLDVMYKFKFNEMLAANASAYLIVGAFQVGCRVGMEASF
jgi:hypothetical protein